MLHIFSKYKGDETAKAFSTRLNMANVLLPQRWNTESYSDTTTSYYSTTPHSC